MGALVAALALFTPAAAPPPRLAAALAEVNAGRAAVGAPPFAWDDRLGRAAQELAGWADATARAGGDVQGDAHHDFRGRLTRSGYARPGEGVIPAGECGPSGGTSGFVPRSPAAHARHRVWQLTRSNLASVPGEPHVRDFRDPRWTRVGIGCAGGMFVLTYGVAR